MGKVRIAVISSWFLHVRKFASLAQSYDESEIAAVWDYDRKRGEAFARELGCPFEPDYDVLLADAEINAFLIMAPVTMHEELIVKAIKSKKHVFTEKPLSVSLEGAYAIQDAVKESRIHFVMSDPIVKPAMLQVRKMADEGLIGDITCLRVRAAGSANVSEPDEWALSHTAEEMGGGDFMDVGHHAVHSLEWFLGKPCGVTALFARFSKKAREQEFEDNGAAIYRFNNGVIGIVETGSVSCGSSYELNLYGTKGCIQATRTHVRYCLEDGKWIDVPGEEFPEGLPYVLKYWILGIIQGEQNTEYDVDCSVRCLEMIMAAYASGGKEVPIVYREDI